MQTNIPIKIQIANSLSTAQPSRIVAVKADGDTTFTLWVTDKTGVPYPLKDNTGGGGGTIEAIQNTDGNLTITGTTTKTINVSSSLLLLINSALQAGDNVSELTNDANYITLADIPAFVPSDYDLEDFTNAGVDPFAHISDVGGSGINTAFVNIPYSAVLSLAYDPLNPNIEIDLTGNLDLTITGTSNGDSGLLNLYFPVTTYTTTLNGFGDLIVSGTNEMIPVYFIHDSDGIRWYNGDTGLAIGELHNVNITGTTDNKFIASTTEGLWENKTIDEVLGYTPADVLDAIPLSGTTVGNPVRGNIEFLADNGTRIYSNLPDYESYMMINGDYVKIGSTNTNTGIYSAIIARTEHVYIDSNSTSRGLVGENDFSPNITDLDYTQKIYVDTKEPLKGSDDNYVTDAEKVIIGNTSGTNTGDQDLSAKQDALVSGTNIKTKGGISLLGSGDIPNSAKITTTVSITNTTLTATGDVQEGKIVKIDNGVNVINYTVNGAINASFIKMGTGAITFVQGSGRTLTGANGTLVFNGAVNSTASIVSDGTVDVIYINNL